MAFVNVDDTSPLFNYKDNAWSPGGITGEFGSTHHSTSTAGAQVMFGPFTGSSISVFSTVGTSQPKVHFQVDGGDQNVDLPAMAGTAVQFQRQLYSASNLDPTQQHTLQINVLDAGPFTLDFVQIGTTGAGDPTTSNTPTPITTTITTVTTTQSSTHLTSVQSPTTTSANTTPASTQSTSSVSNSATPTISPSNPTGTASTSSIQTSQPVSSTQQIPPEPTMSSDASSSTLSTSTSSPTAEAALGAGSSVDGAVIGSVTGAIILLALLVVGLVLYLRRRRFQQRRPEHTKELGGGDWPPTRSKRRPNMSSLRLNLSFTGSSQRLVSPFLPTHRANISDTTNASSVQPAPPRPSPQPHSFLDQDPSESPVFDIKQRPISGATMTTRVTVGTNVSERASVPDFAYEYPFREPAVPVSALVPGRSAQAQAAPILAVPPLKDFANPNNSPSTETTSPGETWTNATSFGFVSRNPTTSSTTSSNSPVETDLTTRSQSVWDMRAAPTSVNPTVQGLQSLSPNEKAVGSHYASNPSISRGQAAMAFQRPDATYRPTSFYQSFEKVLHQDAGITLESSLGGRRVDLPPDYDSLRFYQ